MDSANLKINYKNIQNRLILEKDIFNIYIIRKQGKCEVSQVI